MPETTDTGIERRQSPAGRVLGRRRVLGGRRVLGRRRVRYAPHARWRLRPTTLVVILVLLAGLAVAGPARSAAAAPGRPGRPTNAPDLARLLLSGSDVPQGWKKVATPRADVSTHLGCLGSIATPAKGWHHREAVFTNGKGLPFVSEALATGARPVQLFQRVRSDLGGCRSATIVINGKRDHVAITPRPFTSDATGALASRWRLTATGLALDIEVVVFRVHQVIGNVSYVDVGTGDVANAEGFADAAIAKAGGATARSAAAVRGVVSVATAPVRVAKTSDGAVAYRAVGSGPPLLLVMGYGGSMETWEPQFVDALAHRFRVVIFDNAGIGKTSSLPAPLTVDAMAEQTSALVRTLHLGAPDVLGWSMGGLVAEAFAVLHPAQVHRLVLCATYPGAGAVRPPQSVVDDLNAGGARAASVLFPPGHAAAATVFSTTTSFFTSISHASPAVIAAQATAILQAWAGKDPALARYRQIAAPTLVADGAADRLVPPPNARALAAGITGATLRVYKGAGHAFLFQKLGAFVPAVESFLSA